MKRCFLSILIFCSFLPGCFLFIDEDDYDDWEERGPYSFQCWGLPENAEWNTVDTVVVENHDDFVDTHYNEEPSTTECRYKCNEGYEYNGGACLENRTFGEWSIKSNKFMTWQDAQTYCEDLEENGFSDWRLPSISELRTLLVNCAATESGGKCKVSDYCIGFMCWDALCTGCKQNSDDENNKTSYSKLGDTEFLWSSSVQNGIDFAWGVSFGNGSIGSQMYSDVFGSAMEVDSHKVRCFRMDKGEKRTEPCGVTTDNAGTLPDTEIEQTWTGSEWEPSAQSVYSKESDIDTECRFACCVGYDYKDNKCVEKKIAQGWSSISKSPLNWDDAKKYCEDLVEDGHDKWRFPIIKEVRELIKDCETTELGGECDITGGRDNRTNFGECYGCFYCYDGMCSKFEDRIKIWSSTIRADDNSRAYYVDFEDAGVRIADKKSVDSFFVRCVRDELYFEKEVNVFTKNCTGLPPNAEWYYNKGKVETWQDREEGEYYKESSSKNCKFKCKDGFHWTGFECIPEELGGKFAKISDEKMSFTDAEKYCEELVENGYHDYRLPTISELRSLVKNCEPSGITGECKVTDECLDTICFDENCGGCKKTDGTDFSAMGDAGVLWSSSVVTGFENEVWALDFDDAGFKKLNKEEDTAFIRCAR